MPRPGTGWRPGSAIVPSLWEQHHRPSAETAFTATCVITRQTSPLAFDRAAGRKAPTGPATLVYEGRCRLQVLSLADVTRLTGEQQVTTNGYRVSLPAPVDAQVDDTVTVTATTGDPTLVGDPDDPDSRHLTVSDVARGSLLWQRDLLCIDNLG